jgi:hypothetical protein
MAHISGSSLSRGRREDRRHAGEVAAILVFVKDAALPIEKELLAEKAAALGRAGESLTVALAALRQAEAALTGAAPDQLPALRVRRRELREVAAERLWYVLVQREAVGIFQHEGLLREQQVPPEVRLLAGPRRRR